MSDWFLIPLLQMAAQPGFSWNIQKIIRRFRFLVTAAQLECGIKKLVELELLLDRGDGHYELVQNSVEAGGKKYHPDIRSYHRQMMMRAAEALETQALSEREFLALSLSMDGKNLESAKKELRKFVEDFCEKYQDKSARNVMQLNLQLFHLV